jgi:tetratricopeptide (TPR) repeat protein
LSLLLAALLALPASAATTRRQFDRAVAGVKASPRNMALRERVIELSKQLRPAPAIPEEAKRRLEKGLGAVADAKLDEDYLVAAAEFEAASVAAPWWGDPYHHLGVVYEKAKQPAQALAALRLALAVDPEDKDVKSLLARVEHGGAGKKDAPPLALEGLWTESDDGKPVYSEGMTRKADWRGVGRPDGSVELRLVAYGGAPAKNSERFHLKAEGEKAGGLYLWDGHQPNGRRLCPAKSSAATGTLTAEGAHLALEFRGPLPDRGCGEQPRGLSLMRVP